MNHKPVKRFTLPLVTVCCCLVAQSCPTLLQPHGLSSVHGISQAIVLEWVAISSSKGSSWPRDRTHVEWCVAAGQLFFKLLCRGKERDSFFNLVIVHCLCIFLLWWNTFQFIAIEFQNYFTFIIYKQTASKTKFLQRGTEAACN